MVRWKIAERMALKKSKDPKDKVNSSENRTFKMQLSA